MQLSKNERTTLVFYVVLVAIVIYDVVGMLTHPTWGERMPMFVMRSMDFMVGLLFPLLIFLSAIFISLVLSRARAGMYGILVVGGVINTLWNIAAGYWRVAAGEPYGAFICLVAAALGVAILYYGVRSLGEARTAAVQPDRTRAAT